VRLTANQASGTLMHTTSDPKSAAADRELSLFRGGPFYSLQRATRLIHQNEWYFGRRITLGIALGWLPLILITAVSNPGGLISLLKDYRVHSRMLIAVPVLLVGQLLMEERFRMVVTHIIKADLLLPSDLAIMDDMIASLRRLRDSWIP